MLSLFRFTHKVASGCGPVRAVTAHISDGKHVVPGNFTTAELLSSKQTQPELGPDSNRLQLEADTGSDIVHMQLSDADVPRYEVPKWLLRPADSGA